MGALPDRDIDGLRFGAPRRCRCGHMRVDNSDRAGWAHGFFVTHGLLLCQVPYPEITRERAA